MEKEILEKLSENIRYFKDVKKEDFELLNDMEVDELGLINNHVAKITPLISQLVKYAMIMEILTDEEQKDLSTTFEQIDDSLYSKVFTHINLCNSYVRDLIDKGCKHPSILKIMDIEKGIFTYDEIQESICMLIPEHNDKFFERLLDLSGDFDESILSINYEQFKALLDIVESYQMTSPIELLKKLSKYTNKKALDLMSLQNYNFPVFDWCYRDVCFCINKYPLLLGDALKEIAEYEIYDEDLYEILEYIKEAYNLYNSYRYSYIKNDYKENWLLEKCKKM